MQQRRATRLESAYRRYRRAAKEARPPVPEPEPLAPRGLRRYRKRVPSYGTAIRLGRDTAGFRYRKWGARQICKPGDWIVDSGDDVYTVDAESFAATYEQVRPNVYQKTAPVWAEVVDRAGTIRTKEGTTAYREGNYLVYSDQAKSDEYAVEADVFVGMYDPID